MASKQRILIVDDDENIAELVNLYLTKECFDTLIVNDGDAALNAVKTYQPNLILLDIMLPGKDGFTLLEELKEHEIPVICLTAMGDLHSKVKGLKDGAEDYVVKPFEMLELLVRIDKVLGRRAQSEAEEEICIRDVVVDAGKRAVLKAGEPVALQPMEFDCLMAFWKYRNRVMTREQILNILWGCDFQGETRTVDVHVANLRRKLDFADVIITVPRIGYRMEV